ncbi:MAG: HAMP domain-containing histidine kinase, partial [Clostridia bacterium]|nr:HAMP domain-containing histidine kinase [Clostridia bacterium]
SVELVGAGNAASTCGYARCLIHTEQNPVPLTKTKIQGMNSIISGLLRQEAPQPEPLYMTVEHGSRDYMLHAAAFYPASGGDVIVVFADMPVDSMNATIAVLTDQMLIISLAVVALAMLIAMMLANRIAAPIISTNETAKHLAEGDYTVVFPQGNFREINQLSDTLNYATKGLSEVDRLRKELIANVSHDLRTPLTMIRAYAEMLLDFSGEDEKKRNEHLGVIMNETDRLNKLVRDLLTISQMQTGDQEMEDKPFDLAETAEYICQAYRPMAEQNRITLAFQAPAGAEGPTAPVVVYGDKPRIEQVLHNLISNALNYTPEQGEVTVIVAERKNRWVRVSVIDTGCGISADELSDVWNRYTRAREHKSKSGGTGLGLSIVREILTASDARFGATSRVNVGSTFWFELRAFPRGAGKKAHTTNP